MIPGMYSPGSPHPCGVAVGWQHPPLQTTVLDQGHSPDSYSLWVLVTIPSLSFRFKITTLVLTTKFSCFFFYLVLWFLLLCVCFLLPALFFICLLACALSSICFFLRGFHERGLELSVDIHHGATPYPESAYRWWCGMQAAITDPVS